MKKFITAVLFSVLLFFVTASHFKAKAYWNVLGLEIPSSMREIKEAVGMKVDRENAQGESSFNPVSIIIAKIRSPGSSTSEIIEGEEKSSSNLDEGKVIFHSLKGEKEVIRRSTYEGMLSVIEITPDMINDFLDSRVERKSYMGYTVESADVSLFNDGARVNISMADGKALSTSLELTSDGKGIVVNSIENTGSVKFSIIEMAVIKGLLSSAPQKIFEAFPDYKNKFEFITITPEFIDIWVR